MAYSIPIPIPILVLTILILSLSASAIPEPELQSALSALRSQSYTLFANAISTSNLYTSLLSHPLSPTTPSQFTLFAPPDTAVFSLDMNSNSPSEYLSALRRHIVPRRLSLLTLRSARNGAHLQTLDRLHSIHLESGTETDIVTVDGISVTVPGLFYSRNIAVHGLAGTIVSGDNRANSPPPPDVEDYYVDFSHPPTPPAVPHHHIASSPPPISSENGISPTANIPPSRPVVPHHQIAPSPPPNSPENGISLATFADSPENLGSPAGSITPVMAPVSHVEAPLKSNERNGRSKRVVGHVLIGKGNTFTQEPKQPMHTCMFS